MWGEKVRVLKNLLDRDGELVLPLKGKFTHRNFADFVAVTEALAASRPQCFVVEMSELAFIDSGGIGMLLMALDVARRHDIRLVLRGAHGQVRAVLDNARLEDLICLD
jgi:anti-anti-sigma factor